MCRRAYGLGREMIWSHVAHLYMESFQRARRGRIDRRVKPLAIHTLDERPCELPKWRLDHLMRMTDSTGLLQHAKYTLPEFRRGLLHRRQRPRAAVRDAPGGNGARHAGDAARDDTYAAFLDAAFEPQRRRFRNFLSFDRRWVHEDESAPTTASAGRFGRWAPASADRSSGTCRPGRWSCFIVALPHSVETELAAGLGRGAARHPRVSAPARRRPARQPGATTLIERLIDLYERTATADWPWFEEIAQLRQRRCCRTR